MPFRPTGKLPRNALRMLSLAAVLHIVFTHAWACPVTDAFDRSRELAAIQIALAKAGLAPENRREAERLLTIAAVDPGHLSANGLYLQDAARRDAMKLLGLERIPAKPAGFGQVAEKLNTLPTDAPGKARATALLDEAERAWQAGDHTKVEASLAEAKRMLGIPFFRCG
jgi:hypothetical protein